MDEPPRSIRCRHCHHTFSFVTAELCVTCRAPALVCTECGRCSFASPRRQGSCLGTWANLRGRQESRPIVVSGNNPDEVVTRVVILSHSPQIQSFASRILELFGLGFEAERGGLTAMKPLAMASTDLSDATRFTGRDIYRILSEDLGDDCPVIVVMVHSDLASEDRIEVLGSSVVDVFSHEEMDAATARWFLEMALFGEEPLS